MPFNREMAKFERFVDITLIFYFCLLMTPEISTSIISVPTVRVKTTENDLKLRLVSMVFRHGDRTIEFDRESYPNDPYKNYSYYPNGNGQLTNVGKHRAYDLGVLIRNKYDSFLGDVYYPPNVYAHSTGVTRTKMTLQLVLAGLYPPIGNQTWHSKLAWQPTDTVYNPLDNDSLLLPFTCKPYAEAYDDVLGNPEVVKKINEFNDFMKDLTRYTGLNVTGLNDIVRLYSTLYAESAMNLTLPEWTQDIFPNGRLLEGFLLFLDLLSWDHLKKLNGAVLLDRICDDMNRVINRSLDRKINLFSGHDLNVAALLHALNIPVHHYPAYTSSVIIELYEKNENNHFVKVLYYSGIPSEVLEVNVPNCEVLCPYNKFIDLTESTNTFKLPCHPADSKESKTDSIFNNFFIN